MHYFKIVDNVSTCVIRGEVGDRKGEHPKRGEWKGVESDSWWVGSSCRRERKGVQPLGIDTEIRNKGKNRRTNDTLTVFLSKCQKSQSHMTQWWCSRTTQCCVFITYHFPYKLPSIPQNRLAFALSFIPLSCFCPCHFHMINVVVEFVLQPFSFLPLPCLLIPAFSFFVSFSSALQRFRIKLSLFPPFWFLPFRPWLPLFLCLIPTTISHFWFWKETPFPPPPPLLFASVAANF